MQDANVIWPKDHEWICQIADLGSQGNWTDWYKAYNFSGNKPVLIGFVMGDHAECMKTLMDAQVMWQRQLLLYIQALVHLSP